jgi:hypothetical protein
MNRFWEFQAACGVNNNDLDVPHYLAPIRIFGLKLDGSGNVSDYTPSDLCRIMSAELTQMACENPLLERILSLPLVVLLKIEGKCAGLRAKSVHISGHLPSGA